MSTQQKWVILKAVRNGKYLNSPKTWHNMGMIEDDLPQSAVVRACFICGSSEVAIVPENEFHPK
jgi:hypothetical protein